jgi:hypothetical protein
MNLEHGVHGEKLGLYEWFVALSAVIMSLQSLDLFEELS